MADINSMFGSVGDIFTKVKENAPMWITFGVIGLAGIIGLLFLLRPLLWRMFYPVEVRIVEMVSGGGVRWFTDYGKMILNKDGSQMFRLVGLKMEIEPLPKDCMTPKGGKKYIAHCIMDTNRFLHPLPLVIDEEDARIFLRPRRRDVFVLAANELTRRFQLHNVDGNAQNKWMIGGVVIMLLAGMIILYFLKTAK